MAVQYDPIAKDQSINTTESPSRNIADVLAQELSGIASAITGGSDKVPKTDVATVEPSNAASRAYAVGELVYVNGNLYKVITAISIGATFTVGTNIQSTNVSDTCMELRAGYENLPITSVNPNVTIVVTTCEKVGTLVSFSVLFRMSAEISSGNLVRFPYAMKQRHDFIAAEATGNTTKTALTYCPANSSILQVNTGTLVNAGTYQVSGSYYTNN